MNPGFETPQAGFGLVGCLELAGSADEAVAPGVEETRQVPAAREAALEEHRKDRAERTSKAPPGRSFGAWVS
jgi:hypothetical protein